MIGIDRSTAVDSNSSELLADETARGHYESLARWAAFGPVSVDSWTSIARPHLSALLPFRSMLGVFGRRSFDQIEVDGLVSIDHPVEHVLSLSHTFNLKDRPILARWLATQTPMLIDIPESDSASTLEVQEARRFGLDRLGIHGHLDLLGHTGTYFSFAGICRSLASSRGEALLALVVPHLHVALCRLARLGQKDRLALTAQERELWRWLAAGRRSAEIAIITGCSEKTVRNRLTLLYRKLGVGSRAEAAREFMLRGN